LTHLTYLEKFLEEKRKLLEEAQGKSIEEREFAEAIAVYGAMVFDSCISYNCILGRWRPDRQVISGLMDVQGFPFKSSYAEWNSIVPKAGFEWAVQKTIDSLNDLVAFLPEKRNNIQVFCGDAAAMPIESKSLDCIIVDPPYHENVMYGEVSDFFYVWLKRTVGDLFSDTFKTELTNKQEEAVANSAMFRDSGGRGSAKVLATQYYQSKMEACFRDMNRVLRDDGVLTVMFTHRKAEAWASLATALINAGFTFTASWPVFTEPGQKFGKFEKGVLMVTVLLACRKRHGDRRGLWEQAIKELYDEAERKVKEHAAQGITGPDLLVSVYGPVLGKFADYSLVKDATGNIKTPEDALHIVADVVNKHHTADIPAADLDTLAYINLIREFPGLQAEYDLARLTTVFGGNITLDTLDVKAGKGLVEKKGGKVNILTAHQRQEKGIINPNKPEDLRSLIDVAHASIIAYEQRGLPAVTELLRHTGRDTAESGYIATLRAIAHAGANNGAARPLATEARTVSSLLEALGHRPEATRQKGESLDDYIQR
jgi:adenine-specific DNA methylase